MMSRVKHCSTCGYEFDADIALGWAFIRTSVLLHLQRCQSAPADRDMSRREANRIADEIMAAERERRRVA